MLGLTPKHFLSMQVLAISLGQIRLAVVPAEKLMINVMSLDQEMSVLVQELSRLFAVETKFNFSWPRGTKDFKNL